METNENIKTLCKARGISLNELAARLKITRQTLHRQATGPANIASLEKIAGALNVPLFVLFHPEPIKALQQYSQRNTRPEINKSFFQCPNCGKILEITTSKHQDEK